MCCRSACARCLGDTGDGRRDAQPRRHRPARASPSQTHVSPVVGGRDVRDAATRLARLGAGPSRPAPRAGVAGDHRHPSRSRRIQRRPDVPRAGRPVGGHQRREARRRSRCDWTPGGRAGGPGEHSRGRCPGAAGREAGRPGRRGSAREGSLRQGHRAWVRRPAEPEVRRRVRAVRLGNARRAVRPHPPGLGGSRSHTGCSVGPAGSPSRWRRPPSPRPRDSDWPASRWSWTPGWSGGRGHGPQPSRPRGTHAEQPRWSSRSPGSSGSTRPPPVRAGFVGRVGRAPSTRSFLGWCRPGG